ncbi:unnamed protein product [Amoebophrya sp. A25]|nr:unnamed protein product [Amoebophrya sp. A25]|eukprot:GSA25T00017291001.1
MEVSYCSTSSSRCGTKATHSRPREEKRVRRRGGRALASRSLCLSLFPLCADAAYFYLSEGQSRTFVRMVAQHQVMSVSYTVSEERTTNCRLEFRDPKEVVKKTKNVAPGDKSESTGRVTYLTQEEGEHTFSITCGESSWWAPAPKLKWSLAIEVDERQDALELPATLVNQEQFSSLDKLMLETLTAMDSLAAENDYETHQMDSFQNMVESAQRTLISLNIFMMLVMGLANLYMVKDLKSFFRSQKVL